MGFAKVDGLITVGGEEASQGRNAVGQRRIDVFGRVGTYIGLMRHQSAP